MWSATVFRGKPIARGRYVLFGNGKFHGGSGPPRHRHAYAPASGSSWRATLRLDPGTVWISTARRGRGLAQPLRGASHLNLVLTHLYSLFSHVLWPIFVPIAVLLLEKVPWRRAVLKGLALAGRCRESISSISGRWTRRPRRLSAITSSTIHRISTSGQFSYLCVRNVRQLASVESGHGAMVRGGHFGLLCCRLCFFVLVHLRLVLLRGPN